MDYSNKSDEVLMQLYAEGRLQAFEVLYERHKGALYRYVVRQIHDQELAHDLYQELWGKIIKSAPSYTVSSKWTTWAYTIAHNLVVDHFRTFKPVEELEEIPVNNAPHSAHERAELAQQLTRCLTKLPAAQREIFLLSQETDFTLNMIAEVVHASHEAVKSRLRYAREGLRQCLAKFGVKTSLSQEDEEAGHDR